MADDPGHIVISAQTLRCETSDGSVASVHVTVPKSRVLRTNRVAPVVPAERVVITTG